MLSRSVISGHPFVPPKSQSEWRTRHQQIKKQVLVSTGLWPMLARTVIEPVIHGRIQRDGYTIEKVYFESLPGHYVSGSLYRPGTFKGRRPTILFPHGHFGNGRLQEVSNEEIDKSLESGGERFQSNARFPVQAPLVTLARHGCVVFQYDMVGRGDSRSISHGEGFDDAEAVLRLQNFMGLQTWNSLRALDFVCGLPDVDATRIGVTGASGGGTQTILLCAIDDRPACAFPAVMVSTSMQGGCACENAPLLRIGMGNVDIAACFAPKPLGMTNANDWTLHFERKGLPELRELYTLLEEPDHVMAQRFPQFKHNFNQASREVMYDWMNTHLRIHASSIREEGINPVMRGDLSVFDGDHRVECIPVDPLRHNLTRLSDEQMMGLTPKSSDDVRRLQDVLRTALEVMIHSRFPANEEIVEERIGSNQGEGFRLERLILSRKSDTTFFSRESVPTAFFVPDNWDQKRLLVWVHERGHAGLLDGTKTIPSDALARLIESGVAVISPNVLLTGEHLGEDSPTAMPRVSMENPRYTLTYNRGVMANRVHDVLTAVGYAVHRNQGASVDLVGFDEAGPWVVLARCLCRDHIRRTIVDFNDFSFTTVNDVNDPRLLPGALKYGDLLGLARLLAPAEILVRGVETLNKADIDRLRSTYDLLGKRSSMTMLSTGATHTQMFEQITRP
jgi:dienelactone hydrolase